MRSSDFFDTEALQTYQAAIAAGKKLVATNNLDLAKKVFTEIIENNRSFPDAYLELAEVHKKLGELEEACLCYNKVIELCRTYPKVSLLRKLLGQEINAKYIKDNPGGEQFPFPKDWIERESDRIIAKRQTEKKFIKVYHKNLRFYLDDITPQPENTKKLLANTDFDPEDSRLTNGAAEDAYLAREAERDGNTETAIFLYSKAISKFNLDIDSMLNLARINFMLGLKEKAFTGLNSLIDNFPKFPLPYFYRANIHVSSGSTQLAQQDYIQFVLLAENIDWELCTRNDPQDLLIIINNIDRKKLTLITQDPETINPYHRIFSIADQIDENSYQGNATEDIEFITREIHRNSLTADLYGARASLHYKLHSPNAILDYALAAFLSPYGQGTHWYFGLSLARLRAGEGKKAQRDLSSTLAFFDGKSNANVLLDKYALSKRFSIQCLIEGDIFLKQNNFEKAEELYLIGISRMDIFKIYTQLIIAQTRQKKFDDVFATIDTAKEAFSTEREKVSQLIAITRDCKAQQEDSLPKPLTVTAKSGQSKKAKNAKSKKPTPATSTTAAINTILTKRNQLDPVLQEQKRLAREERVQQKAEVEAFIKAQKAEEKRLLHEANEIIEIQRQEAEAKKKEQDKRKRENKINRAKARRLLALQRYKANSQISDELAAGSSSDSDIEPEKQVAESSTTNFDENSSIELLAIEKIIFEIFEKANKAQGKNYKAFVVGGSVYDRLRKRIFNYDHPPINDVDYVAEFPFEILCDLFREFPSFRISKIPGLINFEYDQIKIDMLHRPDLSDLNADALTRDFVALYMDSAGKFKDLGFCIYSMGSNKLRSILPPNQVFSTDPFRILRAINFAIKRGLRIPTDLKEQMKLNKSLLTLSKDESKPGSIPAGRLNGWILKVFSEGKASRAFELLLKCETLDGLFPEIAAELKKDYDWIVTQLKITDKRKSPSLEIIYTTLIISAVMTRVTDMFKNKMQQLVMMNRTNNLYLNIPISSQNDEEFIRFTEASAYILESNKIINDSLLFYSVFAKSTRLPNNLAIGTSKWKKAHETVIEVAESSKVGFRSAP